MDDVVDLEEDHEPAAGVSTSPDVEFMGTPRSPEVQFLRSNVRLPPLRPSRPPSNLFGNTDFLDMLPPPPAPMLPDGGFLSNGDALLRQEVTWRARNLPDGRPQDLETFWLDPPLTDFNLTVGLALGISDIMPSFDGPPSYNGPPSYKPPTPPPEGFTRSAQKDDVIVCPNCGEELGVGDEIQKQIWAAKPCGHVGIELSVERHAG